MTLNTVDSPTILAIETSCDETAVSLVEGFKQLSSVVSSQVDKHRLFGGVLPELASREHEKLMIPVLNEALTLAKKNLSELQAVAVTSGPGLIGSLMVGIAAAKSLAMYLNIPLIAVNHLEGHLLAPLIEGDTDIAYPAVVLLVSGGHTMLVLMNKPGEYKLIGETQDDACGEAFDKVARYLSLGYPGGPEIDKLAKLGDPMKYKLPSPVLRDSYQFSFSGLKSAVIRLADSLGNFRVEDISASFQRVVVSSLLDASKRAIVDFGAKSFILAGGVAANSELRDSATRLGEELGIPVIIPERRNCTDNAAMVAAVAVFKYLGKQFSDLAVKPEPNMKIDFAK